MKKKLRENKQSNWCVAATYTPTDRLTHTNTRTHSHSLQSPGACAHPPYTRPNWKLLARPPAHVLSPLRWCLKVSTDTHDSADFVFALLAERCSVPPAVQSPSPLLCHSSCPCVLLTDSSHQTPLPPFPPPRLEGRSRASLREAAGFKKRNLAVGFSIKHKVCGGGWFKKTKKTGGGG